MSATTERLETSPSATQPNSALPSQTARPLQSGLNVILKKLMDLKERTPVWLQASIVAIVLIVLVFPDVLFMRATISFSGLSLGEQMNLKRVCLYPEPAYRIWQHAFYDVAGGVYQAEPMQQFMRFALWNRESPYWNPYSACGQLGPETIVDLKFSFFTILMALSGGSQLAYHVIALTLMGLGVFFLFLTLKTHFRLTFLASVSGCVVYLLNGYMVANLGSNTSQVYLYFPALLFALCAFASKPSPVRFAGVGVINVLLLSTTFLPTCLLLLVSTYAVAAGYLWSLCRAAASEQRAGAVRSQRLARFALLFGIQCLAALVGLGVMAFLYLPLFECMKVVHELADYNSRQFYVARLPALLSLFSAKHFWDAYPYAAPALLFSGLPNNPDFKLGNGMYHLGLLPAVLVASASMWRNKFQLPVMVVLGFLAVVSLGRIFGVPVISDLVGLSIGFKSFGEQYWFQVLAIAFPLLAAFGLDSIRQHSKYSWVPPFAVYCILIGLVLYAFQNYGLRPPRAYNLSSILILLALIPISAAFLLVVFRCKNSRTTEAIACAAFLAFMFVELTHDAIHYRFVRKEYFNRPTEAIRFLKQNTGLNRVASLSAGLLPAEYGSAFQIQQIESLNMNVLPSYSAFFDDNFLKDLSMRWCVFPTMFNYRDEKPNLNTDLLDVLAVKYLIVNYYWTNHRQYLEERGYKLVHTAHPWVIYESTHLLPRIFAVHAIENSDLPDQSERLRTTAFSKDEKLVKLARDAGISAHAADQSAPVLAAGSLTSYHHDNLSATIEVEKPALVVLMDNWHPNWSATVDGQPAYIGKVNSSFRGIVVPAGKHDLKMSYMPRSLPLALLISAACASVLIAAALLGTKFNFLTRGNP